MTNVNDSVRNTMKPDIVYICKGEGMDCYLHPGCVYREDPVAASDWVCKHTLDPECAKYGACDDPAKYPERFISQERREDCGPSYYWEVEQSDLHTDTN